MHRQGSMWSSIVLMILILTALGVTPVSAQGVKIMTPAPTREPRETRPSDENYYRAAAPSVPYDPAFIRPFTRDVQTPDSTGRMGLSGWTAPNTPVGSSGTGQREINGWLSFGITWTWGGPPPASRRTGALNDRPLTLTR